MRQRIDALRCDPQRCFLFDHHDVWCRPSGKDAICSAVEKESNIALFYDWHHWTTYGSLYLGESVFNEYIAWSRSH